MPRPVLRKRAGGRAATANSVALWRTWGVGLRVVSNSSILLCGLNGVVVAHARQALCGPPQGGIKWIDLGPNGCRLALEQLHHRRQPVIVQSCSGGAERG